LTIDEFWKRYAELAKIQHSYEKYNLLIDLLTVAEENEYPYEQFVSRFELLHCATFLGEYELLFDHYFWCLDFFENNEDQLDEWVHEILWAFKWILEHIIKFPHVDQETIQNLFKDFKELLENYQYSTRPYYQFRHKASLLAGDFEKAEEYYQLWINSPRDDMSDCPACELQSQMEYLFQTDQADEALQIAERLLNREVTCDEIPHLTYSKLLLPYLKLGETEDAQYFQSEGYFMIYQKPHMLVEASEHLLFFALTGPKAGRRIFDRHINLADADKNPYGQFCFYLSCLVWGKAMKKNGLRVPFSLNEMESVVLAIADDFDERNGNEHFMNTVRETLDLLETGVTF
jgi:tetratricopeptide (TPR) repeat protein